MLMFFSDFSAKIRSLYALIYVKTTLERNKMCLIDAVTLFYVQYLCHELSIFVFTTTFHGRILSVPLQYSLINIDNRFYFKCFKFYLFNVQYSNDGFDKLNFIHF